VQYGTRFSASFANDTILGAKVYTNGRFGMNKWLSNMKNIFIISLFQVFCVVIGFGMLMMKIINITTPWPIYVIPNLLVFLISFLLSVLFPTELNWTKNIIISIPAAITYIGIDARSFGV
jgi:hypothetical protein